jgi:hypothetical protein
MFDRRQSIAFFRRRARSVEPQDVRSHIGGDDEVEPMVAATELEDGETSDLVAEAFLPLIGKDVSGGGQPDMTHARELAVERLMRVA